MEKILWVCKESYTSLSNFTIPHFSEYRNEAIFIHPTESLLEDPTYLNFSRNHPDINIHTLNDVSKLYEENYRKNTINFEIDRLQKYVEKYCNKITWGELLMSSQIFTTPYHYRFFFKDLSEIDKEYWVLLLFDYFEKLFEKSKPNYIFDFDNSEIGRSILWLVADFHNVSYITLEHTRFKGFVVPNFNLGRSVDSYFLNYFNSIQKTLYLDQVTQFRSQKEIANQDFKNNKTLKRENNSLFTDFKRLYTSLKAVFKKNNKKRKLLGSRFSFPFIANYRYSILFFVKIILRERYLLSQRNKFFESPVHGENYVYFPLHLIPESSTLIKAPFYPNEEEIISGIAKSLPLGWKLYIKEHGAMVGERSFGFYKRIARFSNIRMINIDAYNDPKEWILKSKGVITISGTTAFEAVMLGKSAIVLGSVPFQMIRGVKFCHSLRDLSFLINENFTDKAIDNKESCEKYIQTVRYFGQPVKFTFLHNICYDSLLFSKPLTQEGVNQISKIAKVFEKGMEITKLK